MKIKPLGTNVLLKVVEQKTTKSGIILSNDKLILEEGEVLAVGPDVSTLKVKDTAVFKSYDLQEVELDGDKCVFIKEEDILAVK